jgi:outer membrane protein assembly factor BamB
MPASVSPARRACVPPAASVFTFVLLVACALLSGCSWLSNPFVGNDPKRAELPSIKATVEVRADFSYSIGKAGEAVFYPAVAGEAIFVAAADGSIARLENGVQQWRIKAGRPLSAGVGSDGARVVVGTRQGEVLAFSARDGSPLWQAKVSSEVLAPPLLENDLIIVKSSDHHIEALDAEGKRKWFYQRPSPGLSLRSTAPLALADQFILSGFPGGKLVALSSQNGVPIWEGVVALPKGATEPERITDVVSPPAVAGPVGCAVAYQGRVTCFDFAQSGNVLWARNLSSYVGLSVDAQSVYVTDDDGAVHAFDINSGSSRWKMDRLLHRQLTAPQVISAEYLAAGDGEGYVHIIDKNTGALVGRFKTDGGPILVAPQRLSGGKILAQTQRGRVYVLDVR